jgi:TRAP-type C4-dicarboxylate transport system permease small subunit
VIVAGRRATSAAAWAIDRLSTGMAYVAGAAFFLTALYVTVDVTARGFVGVFSGVTDEVGGYVLAGGAMWGLAHALRRGGHVRVDVLLPYMPGWLRAIADGAAMGLMALFALVLAVLCWQMAWESFTTGARAISFSATPLGPPQALLAFGLTVLAAQAAVLTFLPVRHDGGEADGVEGAGVEEGRP